VKPRGRRGDVKKLAGREWLPAPRLRLSRDLRRRRRYDPRDPRWPPDDHDLFEEPEIEGPDHYEPSGDELVVLARSDYDVLVAAAHAMKTPTILRSMTNARPSWKGGLDARLPPEVSARLLKGESLLKALRNWRDERRCIWLQDGHRPGILSDLESGRRKGTPETMKLIAGALNVPLQWLLD